MTPELVRELVDYNSQTGLFTWKRRKLRPGLERLDKGWNTRFAGKIVPPRYHRHGHCQIGLFCKNYMSHRIAWMHFYGEIPSGHLDHKNGNPSDNRISNLRIATQSQNMCNAKKRIDNTSGITGVSWSKKWNKWYSYININKKMIPLGLHKDLDDAIAARRAAEKIYHGEFARAA